MIKIHAPKKPARNVLHRDYLDTEIVLEVDASRVVQQPTGEFYADIVEADFKDRLPPVIFERPDDHVRVRLTVRGDTRDYGNRLYMRFPKTKEAWHIPDHRVIHAPGTKPRHTKGPAFVVPVPEKAAKIVPSLADELLFAKRTFHPTVERKVQDRVMQSLRVARKFVFDSAASYRLGELLVGSPEMIAEHSDFVRLPFPRTWIELDSIALWRGQNGGANPNDIALDQDIHLGFLYDGNTVYTSAAGDMGRKDQTPKWWPARYHLHRPASLEQQQQACDMLAISRAQLDNFYWGKSFDGLSPSQRSSLRARHMIEFFTGEQRKGTYAPLVNGGGTGDLRIILAAAMLLLRPNLTETISERGVGRKLTAGKIRTFLAHTVVTIKLKPDRLTRRIVAAAKDVARAIRWHEVRSHYCHNKEAKRSACIHDWEEVEPDRWQCRRDPSHKRWWRTVPNGRGDASIGVVTKHYHVTP